MCGLLLWTAEAGQAQNLGFGDVLWWKVSSRSHERMHTFSFVKTRRGEWQPQKTCCVLWGSTACSIICSCLQPSGLQV